MTQSVRRHGGASSVVTVADCMGAQKAEQLATGGIERELLGVGLAM